MSNRSTAIASLKHNLSINLRVIRQRVRDARAYIKAFAQWFADICKAARATFTRETPTPRCQETSRRTDTTYIAKYLFLLVCSSVPPSRDLSSCHYRQITNGTEAAPPRVIGNYGRRTMTRIFASVFGRRRREEEFSGNST